MRSEEMKVRVSQQENLSKEHFLYHDPNTVSSKCSIES